MRPKPISQQWGSNIPPPPSSISGGTPFIVSSSTPRVSHAPRGGGRGTAQKKKFWSIVILIVAIIAYITLMVHLFSSSSNSSTTTSSTTGVDGSADGAAVPHRRRGIFKAAAEVGKITTTEGPLLVSSEVSTSPDSGAATTSSADPSSAAASSWLRKSNYQVALLRILSKQILMFSQYVEPRLWGGMVESVGGIMSVQPHIAQSYIITGTDRLNDDEEDEDPEAATTLWRMVADSDVTDEPTSRMLAVSALPRVYFSDAVPIDSLTFRSNDPAKARKIYRFKSLSEEAGVKAAIRGIWADVQQVHRRILLRRLLKVNLRALFIAGKATLHNGGSTTPRLRAAFVRLASNHRLKALIDVSLRASLSRGDVMAATPTNMRGTWLEGSSGRGGGGVSSEEKVITKILLDAILGIKDEAHRVDRAFDVYNISTTGMSTPSVFPIAYLRSNQQHVINSNNGTDDDGSKSTSKAAPTPPSRLAVVSPYKTPIKTLSLFTTIKPCYNKAIQYAQLDAISTWVGLPIITSMGSVRGSTEESLPDPGVTVYLLVGGTDGSGSGSVGRDMATDEQVCSQWIADTINNRVASLVDTASAAASTDAKKAAAHQRQQRRLPPVVVVPRSDTPRGKHGTVLLGASMRLIETLTKRRMEATTSSPVPLLSGTVVYGFINADILLDPVSAVAIHRVLDTYQEAFIVGKRRSVEVDLKDRLSLILEEGVDATSSSMGGGGSSIVGDLLLPQSGWNRSPIFRGSKVDRSDAEDYFIWTESFFSKKTIPDFHIGRPAYDNFLVHAALHTFKPVVDASSLLIAYHQKHDYQHLKGNQPQQDGDVNNQHHTDNDAVDSNSKKKKDWSYWGTEETEENRRLGEENGGWQHGVIDFIPIVFSNPAADGKHQVAQLPPGVPGGGRQMDVPELPDTTGRYRRIPGDVITTALLPPSRHFRAGLHTLLTSSSSIQSAVNNGQLKQHVSAKDLLALELGSENIDNDIQSSTLLYTIPNCAAQVEGSAVMESLVKLGAILAATQRPTTTDDLQHGQIPNMESIQEVYDTELADYERRRGGAASEDGTTSTTSTSSSGTNIDAGVDLPAEVAHVQEHLRHAMEELGDMMRALTDSIDYLVLNGTTPTTILPHKGSNAATTIRTPSREHVRQWELLSENIGQVAHEVQQLLHETQDILLEAQTDEAIKMDISVLPHTVRSTILSLLHASSPSYRSQITQGGRSPLQRTLLSTLVRSVLSHDSPHHHATAATTTAHPFGRDAARVSQLLGTMRTTSSELASSSLLKKMDGDVVGSAASGSVKETADMKGSPFMRFECPLGIRDGWRPLSDGQYGDMEHYLSQYRKYQRNI